ncbi:MAG: RHS repeat-associated core domain-containing protein, partial [Planctomycetota bacterium]
MRYAGGRRWLGAVVAAVGGACSAGHAAGQFAPPSGSGTYVINDENCSFSADLRAALLGDDCECSCAVQNRIQGAQPSGDCSECETGCVWTCDNDDSGTPCEETVEDIVNKIFNESTDPEELLAELCRYTSRCPGKVSRAKLFEAYRVIWGARDFDFDFPGEQLDEESFNEFIDDCKDGEDDPEVPEPPFPPPSDPNGGGPGDGPDHGDPGGDWGGGNSDNRGGRCSSQALTGSPSFEQFTSDPAECPGGSSIGIFDIDLFTGRWAKKTVDLALPAEGFSWVIGRSYNGAQWGDGDDDGDEEYVNSNGIQGWNWRQDSMPSLRLYAGSSASREDALVLVLNADSYIAFGRKGTSDAWEAVSGKGGIARKTMVTSASQSTDYQIYEVYDLTGMKMSFFGYDSVFAGKTEGQLWKVEDPAGNVAYVGDETDPYVAADTGYTETSVGSGVYSIATAHDSSGREYTYAYTAVPDIGPGTLDRLESITVTTGSATTATVEYEYYSTTMDGMTEVEEDHGTPGDLKLVRVITPMSDGNDLVERTYYRYWKDGETGGYDHGIQYVYESEGLRRADIALGDGDHATDDTGVFDATDPALESYASLYLKYFSATNRRVAEVWGQGECGCGTGSATPGIGTHTISYAFQDAYGVGASANRIPWVVRTTIEFPGVTENSPSAASGGLEKYEAHYFGIGGSRYATATFDGDPTGTPATTWASVTDFRAGSLGARQLTPAAVGSFDYASGSYTYATKPDGMGGTLPAGLVYVYEPWEDDDTGAGTSVAQNNYGRTRFVAWQEGGDATGVSDYLSETENRFQDLSITAGQTATATKEFVSRTRRYPDGGDDAATAAFEQTDIDYEFYGTSASDPGNLIVEWIEVSDPIVPTAENGSNIDDSITTTYYREDGTLWWIKEADGVLSYMRYDDNMLVESVQDANASLISDQPSGGLTSPPTPKHIVTAYTYDLQERLRTTTLPNGRELNQHYGVLDDGQIVSIGFPGVDGSSNLDGPASFSLSGHNGIGLQSGRLQVGAGVKIADEDTWIKSDETDVLDPNFFVADLVPVRLSESDYDSAGDKMTASRTWYDLDGLPGDQYDETTYGYDELGRVVAVRAPHGTISRTVYDAIGRPVGSWIGTNDSDFVSPQVTVGTDDMNRLSTQVYDGGGSGNSLVTTSKSHVVDDMAVVPFNTTRETEYGYDARDRLIVTKTPEPPFRVVAYDNLDRVTASATYGVVTNLTEDTDPNTYTTDRLTLSETFYDTRGRAYRSKRYEIDQATGAIAQVAAVDQVITENRWYDTVGQLVKTTGSSLRKMRYDSLRRVVRSQTLSRVDDSVYSHALDTLGDTVVSETVTHYDDDTGNVLTSMSLSRHPGDTGTGDLYGGVVDGSWESADMGGRPRIAAMWYDGLDRLFWTVDYGTYGAADFVRASSPPDRQTLDRPAPGQVEIGHLTRYQYNGDGEIYWVQSPRDGVSTGGTAGTDFGVITLTMFDDAGRVVQRTENYALNPPPTELDANRTVEIEYGNQTGLKIKEIAKNSDGTTNTDQVTTYIYGTMASATSPGTGHLLREVVYPDSAGGTDSVRYEYNWLSERTKQTDQAGNVIEYVYDDLGRVVEQDATSIDPDFDDTVQSIETTYEARGMVASVTQLSAHNGSGSVLDTVAMTYDGWGLIEQSDQNPVASDSTLSIQYEHAAELDPDTRQTVRRTGLTYPNGATVEFDYGTGIDSDISRVQEVLFDPNGSSAVSEAEYTYGGVARRLQTLIKISGGSGQNDAICSRWDPDQPAPTTNAGYTYLDRFDRITQDTWTRRREVSGVLEQIDFVSFTLEYDVASNITRVNDTILQRDQVLMNDSLRRLVGETVNASSLSTSWGYDKLGNWMTHSYADSSGVVDTPDEFRFETAVNLANEITARSSEFDGPPSSSNAFTPGYDAVGNMTDDGNGYLYEYDVFGRITTVSTDAMPSVVVARFRYNGLHQRTVWRGDRDSVAGLDDVEYDYVYDDRWRAIMVYRRDLAGTTRDAKPKEATLYHAPGLDGRDGSGKLDEVIARYRHIATSSPADAWAEEALSTDLLDGQGLYFQNWRGDIVAHFERGQLERTRYTPYGEPFAISGADVNGNGATDASDLFAWSTYFTSSPQDPRGDVNFDGVVNDSDYFALLTVFTQIQALPSGEGVLSTYLDNRLGYAGYRLSFGSGYAWHARYRDYLPWMGRWTRRDPIGYADGMNLYAYVGLMPVRRYDPFGLRPSEGVGECLARCLITEMAGQGVVPSQICVIAIAACAVSFGANPACLAAAGCAGVVFTSCAFQCGLLDDASHWIQREIIDPPLESWLIPGIFMPPPKSPPLGPIPGSSNIERLQACYKEARSVAKQARESARRMWLTPPDDQRLEEFYKRAVDINEQEMCDRCECFRRFAGGPDCTLECDKKGLRPRKTLPTFEEDPYIWVSSSPRSRG